MRPLLLLLMLALPAVLPAAPAMAGQVLVEGQRFDHRQELAGHLLRLSGTHVSRWARVLKVSVAALWLPPSAAGRDVLAPGVPRRLEIRYLVDIPGRRLRDGTREVLARNVPPAELARHAAGLAAIIDRFDDVAAGDRYTLSYAPGAGVVLARNGRAVARAGDEVAPLLFAVWLGPVPLDEDKKRALLTGHLQAVTSAEKPR